jgi:hypothetical protein
VRSSAADIRSAWRTEDSARVSSLDNRQFNHPGPAFLSVMGSSRFFLESSPVFTRDRKVQASFRLSCFRCALVLRFPHRLIYNLRSSEWCALNRFFHAASFPISERPSRALRRGQPPALP